MLNNLLKQLKNELSRIQPSIAVLFNPPASAAMIAEAEKGIGRSLPIELKELYAIHNGQAEGHGLLSNWSILSLKELVAEWQTWNRTEGEHYQTLFSVDSISIPRGFIKERYTCPNWIPVAKDFCGNNYAVDMEPGPMGVSGQIIVFGADYDIKYVLAMNFKELISYYVLKFRSSNIAKDLA